MGRNPKDTSPCVEHALLVARGKAHVVVAHIRTVACIIAQDNVIIESFIFLLCSTNIMYD